jgi:hypothetical protein
VLQQWKPRSCGSDYDDSKQKCMYLTCSHAFFQHVIICFVTAIWPCAVSVKAVLLQHICWCSSFLGHASVLKHFVHVNSLFRSFSSADSVVISRGFQLLCMISIVGYSPSLCAVAYMCTQTVIQGHIMGFWRHRLGFHTSPDMCRPGILVLSVSAYGVLHLIWDELYLVYNVWLVGMYSNNPCIASRSLIDLYQGLCGSRHCR